MTSILAFIVVLGVIVFVHELGHFLAAKIVGIRVETFSLGFPPKIWGKKVGETEYMISWIPIGGYVKMAGMIDESLDDKPLTGAPWEFMSKNFFQKIFVISAGVLMNFILAFLLYTGITFIWGVGDIGPAVVGQVDPSMPAYSAGIKSGDLIMQVAGESVGEWRDLTKLIHTRPDEDIEVVWMRGDSVFTKVIHTDIYKIPEEGGSQEIGLIGISPQLQMRRVSFIESITHGAGSTYFIAAATILTLKMLFQGEASIKDFVGPIGIVHYSGETVRSGLQVFLGFIALISINIGFLNILPIPVLDGGHLVYITIEAVIRRPIKTKVKLIIQQIGMALLLLLILFISYNDIMRFFVN